MHSIIPAVTALSLIATVIRLSASDEDLQCIQSNWTTRLTIDSHRNDSGHWVSEVELLHRDANEDAEKWSVDVYQRVSTCVNKSTESVAINATIFRIEEAVKSKNNTRRVHRFFPLWKFPASEGNTGGGLLSEQSLNWEEALEACKEREGTLTFPGPKYIVLLKSALAVFRMDMIYIGMQRNANTQREFRTLSGDPLQTDNLRWATGRPATTGPLAQEACGALTKKGELHDVSCDTQLHFLCQGKIAEQDF